MLHDDLCGCLWQDKNLLLIQASEITCFLVWSFCNRDGKLVGMDVTLYNNGGCSLDLSSSVMDRALFHIDNCYRCETLLSPIYVGAID